MTGVPLRRVRARVTVTVEGELSGAPIEDVRAALVRNQLVNGTRERVQLVEVGDVRLLQDANAASSLSEPESFYERSNLEVLAAGRGVGPRMDFDQLLGDFWPADESADEVIRAVKSWRRTEG